MSSDVGYIDICGKSVAIVGIEVILAEVASLQIVEQKLLKAEFLRRVRASHYVPGSAKEEYAEAFLRASGPGDEVHSGRITVVGE